MNSLIALVNALTAPVSLSALKAVLLPMAAGIRPYKVFTALVSQADTGAPTMTILENTLSGTPVFSYDDVGEYELTLAGEFVNNKTAIFTSVLINDNLFRTYTAVRVSNDVIEVKSYNAGTLANTMLSNSLLEIRIYE
jgi:hypothetical protein